MFHYDYQTQGTCAKIIHLDIENGIVHNVSFEGGCNGNLKAISLLVEGQSAESIIEKLSGNICGNKVTSCADQLTKAVQAARIAASEVE